MKPFDPALASPFRVDWLVPLDAVTQDDFTRAISEKAEAILRSARFIAQHQTANPTDMEVRVWIEAAQAPGCVSITWEPGFHAFGFHLLDDSLKERLAAIVFRDFPCIDGNASDEQADEILRAALAAISEAEADDELVTRPSRAIGADKTVRVSIVEGNVETGVER